MHWAFGNTTRRTQRYPQESHGADHDVRQLLQNVQSLTNLRQDQTHIWPKSSSSGLLVAVVVVVVVEAAAAAAVVR